jgi:hypothetical protein
VSVAVLSNVVIARVAIERLGSVSKDSMSELQGCTAVGCMIATLFSVRMAANRVRVFGDDKNNWKQDNGCNQSTITCFA